MTDPFPFLYHTHYLYICSFLFFFNFFFYTPSPLSTFYLLSTMFYVTGQGQSFLYTFSNYNNYSSTSVATTTPSTSGTQATNSTSPITRNHHNQNDDPPVDAIAEKGKNERSLALYPFVLMVSAILTTLAYLYMLLLTPMVLDSTSKALENGTFGGNNNNSTNSTVPTIPLDINCPALTQRPPSRNVSDLRADDIKAVIGIGDR